MEWSRCLVCDGIADDTCHFLCTTQLWFLIGLESCIARHYRVPFEELTNIAVLETMGRSLNNSLTIIFYVVGLVLLGGESIAILL